MTGLAGMGPEFATTGMPAFSEGTAATKPPKGGSGGLGDMFKSGDTSKMAGELLKMAASRGSSMPGPLPGLPGAGQRGGTQPSLPQFLQLLASRRGR